MVFPSAKTAPRIPCSVAPTLRLGKHTTVPVSLLQKALIFSGSSCILAPSFFSTKRCRSTGLFPITQPPGYPRLPFPRRARMAPRRITEERILPVYSEGISQESALVQSMYRSWPFHQVTAPSLCKISSMQNTSAILGQPFSTLIP